MHAHIEKRFVNMCQKNYAMCIKRKRNYENYKDLVLKCKTNNNYYDFF